MGETEDFAHARTGAAALIQRIRTYQTVAVLCSDLLLTAVAFLAAYWLRFTY